jgi:nicotinamidase-related amidase
MKKQYFTKENLKPKAIFEKVKKYRNYHNIEFSPESSALIIIDMQKYFLSPVSYAYIPSAEVVLPGVKKWWPKLLGEGIPYSYLPEELESYDGTRIEKHRYDAFCDTNLEEVLHKKTSVNSLCVEL